MHLLVADRVVEEFDLHDKARVLLGSVAPDGHNNQRDQTHFKGPRYGWSDVTPYQYGRFVAKYHERFSDGFFIGYLTHLVADDVWASAVYFSGVKERLQSGGAYFATLYRDFYLANAKLLEKPNRRELCRALESGSGGCDEIDQEAMERVKQDALRDFDYPASNVDEPLAVLAMDMIEACIERAAIRAIDVAQPWIDGK